MVRVTDCYSFLTSGMKRRIIMHRINAAVAMLVAGGLLVISGVTPSRALPVTPLDIVGNSPESKQGLVQKAHGWHCRRLYGWYRHYHRGRRHTHRKWHRHPRACYRVYRGYNYGPYVYYGPPRIIFRGYNRGRRYRGPRYRRGRVLHRGRIIRRGRVFRRGRGRRGRGRR